MTPLRVRLITAAIAAVSVTWVILSDPPSETSQITYYSHVEPILRRRCVECHRAGGAALPFLTGYSRVFRARDRIYDAVSSGRMPPWLADPAVGTWANDRRLSDEDRGTLLQWIRHGAPAGEVVIGDTAALPERFTGWRIGQPHKVYQLDRPVQVPSDGVVPYVYRYIRTDFSEDRWITAVEVRPSNPIVLHHALVFVEDSIGTPDAAHAAQRSEPSGNFAVGLSGYFAAYGPGHQGALYPPGHARLLPRDAVLKLQLHYTPVGVQTEDQPEIGLAFTEITPRYRVETSAVVSTDFVIPPGARRFEVTAVRQFERDVILAGFVPHMHLRGVAFRYDLHYSDGRRETLLNVPRYSFGWQEEYMLAKPIHVPSGTWLRATGWYDNSRRNPHNPDHTRSVRFGEQTQDEMMNGYFHYLLRNPDVDPEMAPRP
jgi:mono/diheme cytochrome c family protein